MNNVDYDTLYEKVLASIPLGEKLVQLEKLLKPTGSVYGSSDGFLRGDESFEEVVLGDFATLKKLNLTYEQVADKLESMIMGHGQEFFRQGSFKIVTEFTCGEQNCPWGDDYTDKASVMWLLPDDGKPFYPGEMRDCKNPIQVSGLIPHLIRDHYFFEGKGSPYRVDPERILSLFRE